MGAFYYLVLLSTLWIQLFISSHDTQYWLRKQTPTTRELNRIAFPDTSNGWAVGDSGTIIHTTDGGNSWVLQDSRIDYVIQDVFFLNKNLGWGIANDFFFHGTTILRTSNGGTTWTNSRYPDTTYILNTIYFLDSLNGYIGGYQGVILKTTNGGGSWNRSAMDTNIFNFHPIKRFNFYSLRYGVACGGIMDAGGPIWRTVDSGRTWSIRDTAAEPVNDLVYLDSALIMGTGGDFEFGPSFVRSNDNGTTWKNLYLYFFGIGKALAKRTRADIWIPLGFSQKWAHSLDSGVTWVEYAVSDSEAINDAYFADPLHGWAAGTSGSIYKYNNELIGINPNEGNIPVVFQLLQNYPNPFNPTTSISLIVPKTSRVQIFVYDVLGRVVKKITDELREPGKYSVTFDGGNMSSGIYFYKLYASEPGRNNITFQQARKMVLIK